VSLNLRPVGRPDEFTRTVNSVRYFGSRCSSVMVGVFVIRFGVRLRICWSNFALISVK
jgi:hypothetical protein